MISGRGLFFGACTCNCITTSNPGYAPVSKTIRLHPKHQNADGSHRGSAGEAWHPTHTIHKHSWNYWKPRLWPQKNAQIRGKPSWYHTRSRHIRDITRSCQPLQNPRKTLAPPKRKHINNQDHSQGDAPKKKMPFPTSSVKHWPALRHHHSHYAGPSYPNTTNRTPNTWWSNQTDHSETLTASDYTVMEMHLCFKKTSL